MRLQLSTWPDVEAYLKESSGIIVPIGSTEQHGPNGLIGTDAICPETVAAGVARELGVMIGPTVNIGMAQHHMGFPGSITLRPATLLNVVRDVVESLARHGFGRIYFLNGHGGNVATVNAAFSEVYTAYSLRGEACPFRCKIQNWWMGQGIKRQSHKLFGKAEGSHATPSEVSLTYFAYPDQVREVAMQPELAPSGDIHDAQAFRHDYPDGRIGSNPALASVEAGGQLYEAAVADIVRDYQAFTQEA